ncbi:MAG TPA: PEP-CTERM sorting domain-containing protein [Deltaproteobacteria bacterium]|nr:PEP-CTERM sorting domain-containing protein [Deltaproteobacteria bacterium]
MRKSIKLLFILFLCFFMFTPAQADTIVDTGTLNPTGTGSALNSGQWLAGQFSLSQAYDITDIYGWIYPHDNTGTMTIALYGDSTIDDNPDTSIQYFSQKFIPGGSGADWYGLTGLNISLTAGTYWVSFEVRNDDTNYGSMPKAFSDPLSVMAYFNGTTWVGYDDIPIGIRMYGQTTSVPEPATILFLGFGLIGLAGLRRNA